MEKGIFAGVGHQVAEDLFTNQVILITPKVLQYDNGTKGWLSEKEIC